LNVNVTENGLKHSYFCKNIAVMHTVRLKINDKVYDGFTWLLSKFSKDEVEVIQEDSEFIENQIYLAAELKDINEGKAVFYNLAEVEERLEKIIKKRFC
jgi:hypothetical protein